MNPEKISRNRCKIAEQENLTNSVKSSYLHITQEMRILTEEFTEQHKEKCQKDRPGRTWTTRLAGPVRYRRYTDLDGGGNPSIFFKFETSPDNDQLPSGVYQILDEMKHLQRSLDRGNSQFHTNLRFKNSKTHGRVWILPNSTIGRIVADMIDSKIKDLILSVDESPGNFR